MNITNETIKQSINLCVSRDLHEFHSGLLTAVYDEFKTVYDELPTRKDVRHRGIKYAIKKAPFYDCFLLNCLVRADMNISKANSIMADEIQQLVIKLDQELKEEYKNNSH